jgi:hypothetical protein
MIRGKSFCLIVLLLAWVLLPMGRNLLMAADTLIINAQHLSQAPEGLDGAIWRKIEVIDVPIQGREILDETNGFVSIQAAYTDDSVYFRLRWRDATHSVIKQSWQFNGNEWLHMAGNEDRIALMFEVTRIDKFASRGCAVTCHSPPDVPKAKWQFATRTDVEKGDLWHWKAARSAPYGYADDAWLTVAGNPSGSYRETGRRKDFGAGGDMKNEDMDGSRPVYMQDPDKSPTIPGTLLFEQAVRIQDYKKFIAGDIIPYRMPIKPDGSRFDVKAESQHANGFWTVMFTRKLDTGHEDDVGFNPLKRYSFAMAVFDNSGDDHSKATKPLILNFDR